MLGLNIFFQTDIFSIIQIGFIEYFLHKDTIYMSYIFKNEHQTYLPTIWLIILNQSINLIYLNRTVLVNMCTVYVQSCNLLNSGVTHFRKQNNSIWAGVYTWACFITFRNSMWLDSVLYTYIKHNCSYQHCPVT